MKNTNYKVKLNGEEKRIYTAPIFPAPYNSLKTQEFAILKFDGAAELEIESAAQIREVTVRPLSAGICCVHDAHTIKIKLLRAANFSVELNGSAADNLLIFSSPEKKYELDGMNVIRIDRDTKRDRLLIDRDNTALIIDEGVTLNSKLEINGCKNIKVCGDGIITQLGVSDTRFRICIDILGCENVTIEDITVTESLFWNIRMIGCDNVKINNVKIIGSRGNNDGIDVCSSRNVEVDGAFIRTWDDSFVVKGVDERDKKSVHFVVEGADTDITKAFERVGDVYGIRFKNSTLWNDFARPIELGVSLRTDRVHDIKYENIDIIHSTTGYPLMGAHHGDRAELYDISFEDIRIEDAPGAQLFDFRITDSVWNTDDKKGCMHDFSFKNIRLIGKPGIDILPEASRIEGFSEENSIRNFRFENIELLGKTAKNARQLKLDIYDFAENIEVTGDDEREAVSELVGTLKTEKEPLLRPDGNYAAELLLTLENCSDTPASGEVYVKASPKNSGSAGESVEFALSAGERCEWRISGIFPPGKHCLSIESQNIGISSDKLLLDLDLVLRDDINAAPPMYFTNYYGDKRPPVYMAADGENLTIKSELIKSGALYLYTAMPVPTLPGEVLFTVEETDFGESAALVMGRDGAVTAPQLRCPAEITYVFHNEPKVEKINEIKIPKSADGMYTQKLSALGIDPAAEVFLSELRVDDEESRGYRYAYTMGHSVLPKTLAHMFIKTRKQK